MIARAAQARRLYSFYKTSQIGYENSLASEVTSFCCSVGLDYGNNNEETDMLCMQ